MGIRVSYKCRVRNRADLRHLPIFAYGTLLPGQPNFDLWGEAIMSSQVAVLEGGRLYDMGYYPMLVEEGSGEVKGMIFALRHDFYRRTLERLDELEGYYPDQPDASVYRRVQRRVQLREGDIASAWVYVGRPQQLSGATPVPGGDWVRCVSARMGTLQRWWKDIDTVSGLHG